MLNVAGSSYTNITGADPPLRISAQPKMFKTISSLPVSVYIFPPRCSAGLLGVSDTGLVTREASLFPIVAEISSLYDLVRLAKKGPQRGERRAEEVV